MATQPTITNAAWSTSVAGTVLVQFNTSVNSTDASTSGNYSIPGLTVSGVAYNAGTFVTTLTVTGYAFGTPYTLTCSNIRDVTNALTIGPPGNTFSFLNGTPGDANAVSNVIQPTGGQVFFHTQGTFVSTGIPLGSGTSNTHHQGSKLNPGIN